MLLRVSIVIVLLGLTRPAAAWELPAAVREVPRPSLGEAAAASFDDNGPVIYVNPTLLAASGAMAPFYRAHEYAHIHLGHVKRAWTRPPMHSPQLEREADCYAAQVLDEATLVAAVRFFRAAARPERAQVIDSCYLLERGTRLPAAPPPTCRDVTTYETVTRYETRQRTINVPCGHCGVRTTPFGPRHVCAHHVHSSTVSETVPVTARVPRTTRVCD